MSSKLPISWLSRSAPSSMVSSSSRVAVGVKSTSRCNRLLTDALIDESGVRRSCDTAARSAVRSSFASSRSPGAGRIGPQRALLHGDRRPGRRRPGARRSRRFRGCRRGPPGRRARRAVPRDRRASGASGTVGPTPATTIQPDSDERGQHPDRLRLERRLYLGDELRQRVRRGREGAAQRGQGLGFGSSMSRLDRAARRGGDQRAHDPADEQEDSRARGGSPPRRP